MYFIQEKHNNCMNKDNKFITDPLEKFGSKKFNVKNHPIFVFMLRKNEIRLSTNERTRIVQYIYIYIYNIVLQQINRSKNKKI